MSGKKPLRRPVGAARRPLPPTTCRPLTNSPAPLLRLAPSQPRAWIGWRHDHGGGVGVRKAYVHAGAAGERGRPPEHGDEGYAGQVRGAARHHIKPCQDPTRAAGSCRSSPLYTLSATKSFRERSASSLTPTSTHTSTHNPQPTHSLTLKTRKESSAKKQKQPPMVHTRNIH